MSNALAALLLEKRKQLDVQARAILDKAEEEKRGLSVEEQTAFDQITADMDSLRKQSDQLVKLDADNKAAEEALRKVGHSGPARDSSLNDQFRAVAQRQQESVILRATPEESALLTERRALSKGTATAGGNTVKVTFLERLYAHLIETATLLRGGATTWNTTTGEEIQVPITTAHSTAALVAEAGTIAQSDPAFAKRSLGAYKYAVMILISRELVNDTSVDLEGYLAMQAGRAVGNALGTHLVTGTGSSQPAGLMTLTTLGVTTGTGVAGVPTFDNMIDLYYSVIAPYRNSPNAAWLFKDTTAGALRKLKDSSGRYLWEPSVIPGTPDSILAKPVLTDPNMAATGVNNKSVAFGDLSQYWVRLVNDVRFERSDDFKFDTDQIAYRCLVRGDGMLIDQTGAVKHIVGAAT